MHWTLPKSKMFWWIQGLMMSCYNRDRVLWTCQTFVPLLVNVTSTVLLLTQHALPFLEKRNKVVLHTSPVTIQSWVKQGALFFSQKVSWYFSHCSADAASIIPTPIHIPSKQHWRLLCFDVVSRNVYFDDGLKIVSPQSTLIVTKNMVNGFSVLSSGSRFNLEQWNCPKLYLLLPRINMPQRTTTGVGAGTCDIGVILSVRDIIRSGTCLLSFQWESKDMGLLRKQLMCRIFEWRNNANWLSILLSLTNLLRHLPQDHKRWSILNGILAFPLSLNTMLSRLYMTAKILNILTYCINDLYWWSIWIFHTSCIFLHITYVYVYCHNLNLKHPVFRSL